MEVRTGRLVVNAQHTDRFIVENDKVNSYTEAESEMSLESRSFLHRVNDRVRKMQDQSSKDATQDSNKHSLNGECLGLRHWKHLYSWERIFLENLHSIKNTGKDLTMKQMFDISEKLIAKQLYEIYGVNTINWDDSSWQHISLIGDEEVISLSHAKVYVFFRFCVMSWKGESEPNIKYSLGTTVELVKDSPK